MSPSDPEIALSRANALLDAEHSLVHTKRAPAVSSVVEASELQGAGKAAKESSVLDTFSSDEALPGDGHLLEHMKELSAAVQRALLNSSIHSSSAAQPAVEKVERSGTDHSTISSDNGGKSTSRPALIRSGDGRDVWRVVTGTEHVDIAADNACAAMSSHDGKWRSVPCSTGLPAACRAVFSSPSDDNDSTPASGMFPARSSDHDMRKLRGHYRASPSQAGSSADDSMHLSHDQANLRSQRGAELRESVDINTVGVSARWVIGQEVVFSMESGWRSAIETNEARNKEDHWSTVKKGDRERSTGSSAEENELFEGETCEGCCPRGYVFWYPQSGWDNLHLWMTLSSSGKAAVMLPIIPGVYR
jgi:hypothetical protein